MHNSKILTPTDLDKLFEGYYLDQVDSFVPLTMRYIDETITYRRTSTFDGVLTYVSKNSPVQHRYILIEYYRKPEYGAMKKIHRLRFVTVPEYEHCQMRWIKNKDALNDFHHKAIRLIQDFTGVPVSIFTNDWLK